MEAVAQKPGITKPLAYCETPRVPYVEKLKNFVTLAD
jgi:hypothetical protein